MKPNDRFLNQPMHFWANVRSISEQVGYTERKGANKDHVKIPSPAEIETALQKRGLESSHIIDEKEQLAPFGKLLLEYTNIALTF
jgi:hypothetical protein